MDTDLIEKAENRIAYDAANEPSIKKILETVRGFIEKRRVLCYGGTAINNLIPNKADRFYDPNYDIPDYDFYSEQPQLHAMELADIFHSQGFKSIEVKPGAHLLTFKVFVDFTGVADITYLDPAIFKRLWKEDIVKEGIHYVSPNFLRMSMYLELSRPRGDVSRWSKVYDRLMLLNKYYPVGCPPHKEKEPTLITDAERQSIEHVLQTKSFILLGLHAANLHSNKRTNVWEVPIDILATPESYNAAIKMFTDIFVGRHAKAHAHPAYAELLPEHADIEGANGFVYCRVFKTNGCHSYHQLRSGMKVASIPTLLQFFFAFVYADAHYIEGYDQNRIICICQRLMDLAASTKRRYKLLTPLDCLGHQETLVEMKSHTGELRESLPKKSEEFMKFFFTYKPGQLDKTQKVRVRENLKKTMKSVPLKAELVTDKTEGSL
jgi:hypothetical protein